MTGGYPEASILKLIELGASNRNEAIQLLR